MIHTAYYKTSILIGFAIVIGGAVVAYQGFAWTNPTANPPSGTSAITISGGNVGIGTASPAVKLHVNGSVRGNQAGALRIDSGSGTLDVGAMNASYAHFQTDRPTFYFNKSVVVDGALSNYANAYYIAQSGISYLNGGSVGIGTASPDTNYKITTANGGIKADANTGQAAGYFNNIGGGPAIIAGTGGITLGGVNKTSWPTGIGGSGTANYVAKWTAGSALGNSSISDNGSTVSIATPVNVSGTVHTTGDLLADGNFGLGLVGLYNPSRYRNVYSMGAAYRLAADGTGPGNLYGIANTYEPDYGGAGNNAQAKAGLGHQYLFMANGSTQTAIGTGIWTNGNTYTAGTLTSGGVAIINGGSSSNWASVNAPTFNAGTSIYSYGSICAGNASGTCGGSGGTVIGAANTTAANNIPNAGNVIFNNGSNVGIGTTGPLSKLSVGGAGVASTAVYGKGSNYGLYGYTPGGVAGVYGQSDYDTGVYGYGGTNGVIGKAYDIGFGATGVYGEGIYNSTYASSGYGVYGKSPNGYGVYCNGMYCGGNKGWTNSSDARLKTNIQDISGALGKVLRLRGVTFDWKDGSGSDMGFIAQEAKDVVPEVIGKDQDDHYTMRTASLTGILVEAIKEQQKQIETLQEKITTLEGNK